MCFFARNQKWNDLPSRFRPFSGLLTKAEMRAYLEVQMILIFKNWLSWHTILLAKKKICHWHWNLPFCAYVLPSFLGRLYHNHDLKHLRGNQPPPTSSHKHSPQTHSLLRALDLFPPFHITCCSIPASRQGPQVFPAQCDSRNFCLHKCRPASEVCPGDIAWRTVPGTVFLVFLPLW